MKLHLGCGKNKIQDYINIDFNETADIVHDVRDLSIFNNETIDEIYISHCLEHFSRREIIKVLQEYNRVLKVNGTLRVAVPDFDAVVKVYKDTGKIQMGLLYGGQINEHDYHKIIFNFNLIKDFLECCGFCNVDRYDAWEFLGENIDDYSKSYIPHMDRNGTLMSLNVKCTKKDMKDVHIASGIIKQYKK